jgi:hypothetical protein
MPISMAATDLPGCDGRAHAQSAAIAARISNEGGDRRSDDVKPKIPLAVIKDILGNPPAGRKLPCRKLSWGLNSPDGGSLQMRRLNPDREIGPCCRKRYRNEQDTSMCAHMA